jgi:hypothetical protein
MEESAGEKKEAGIGEKEEADSRRRKCQDKSRLL